MPQYIELTWPPLKPPTTPPDNPPIPWIRNRKVCLFYAGQMQRERAKGEKLDKLQYGYYLRMHRYQRLK